MIKVSERLRQIIETTGLSQKAVAQKLGITPAHVTNLLQGKREASDQLARLIEAIWPETGEGEMFREGKRESEGPYRHPDPTIQKIVELLEGMDADTKEDICLSVQKEKLLRDLLKEKQERKAG